MVEWIFFYFVWRQSEPIRQSEQLRWMLKKIFECLLLLPPNPRTSLATLLMWMYLIIAHSLSCMGLIFATWNAKALNGYAYYYGTIFVQHTPRRCTIKCNNKMARFGLRNKFPYESEFFLIFAAFVCCLNKRLPPTSWWHFIDGKLSSSSSSSSTYARCVW